MKTKTSKLTFLILLIVCSVSFIKAQNDDEPPPPKVSGNKKKETVKVAKYFFVFQIDAAAKVTLSVTDDEYLENIGNIETTDALAAFFEDLKSAGGEKPNSVKTKFDAHIIVKPNENLKYGRLVNFLKKVRNLSDNEIKISTSKSEFYSQISVQKKPLREQQMRPNPLFLLAEIKADGKVTLNAEEVGNLDDLSKLTSFLTQIFKERENNGVFREGTNEVEKKVSIKAPAVMNFSEIMKLIESLNYSGSQPIELQIDDLP